MILSVFALLIASPIADANATLGNRIPNYGTAVVGDNSYAEWDTTPGSTDEFAMLYPGWDPTNTPNGMAYVRFFRVDSTHFRVYVLALASPGTYGVVDDATNWIKTGLDTQWNKFDKPAYEAFTYITDGSGRVLGYETSFILGSGLQYMTIHLQISNPATATAGVGNHIIPIELPPDFQVPEYALGGLIALAACFTAFAVVKKHSATVKSAL